MSNLYRKFRRAAAVFLAAVMTVPVSVSAEKGALDELNRIAEAQNENAPKSLMEETLGLEELLEGVDESGMAFSTRLSLTDGTARQLDLPEEISEGSYFELNAQVDPRLKKWLFEAGLGFTEDQPLFDLSVYGDKDQLALSLPEFFDGAAAVRSGSLLKQYTGSVLEQILGEMPLTADIDLDFFPDLDAEAGFSSLSGDMEKVMEKSAKALEDGAAVETRHEGEQTVYTVVFQGEDMLSLIKTVMDQYNSILKNSGVFGVNDMRELEETWDESYSVMEIMLEDGLKIDYYVKDELINKISFDLVLDLNRVQELERRKVTLEEETKSYDSGAEYDPEDVANLHYVIAYRDPSDPSAGFDLIMTGKDGTMKERMQLTLSFQKEKGESDAVNTMQLTVKSEGETVYNDEIFRSSFDAQTGDYDMRLGIKDGSNEMAFVLDSTFTNMQKGKSFELIIDELSMVVDDERIGIAGTVAMSGEPGEIAAPQNTKMILELTEEEFVNLLMEFQMNVGTWAQQFEPETEEDTGMDPFMEQDAETEISTAA